MWFLLEKIINSFHVCVDLLTDHPTVSPTNAHFDNKPRTTKDIGCDFCIKFFKTAAVKTEKVLYYLKFLWGKGIVGCVVKKSVAVASIETKFVEFCYVKAINKIRKQILNFCLISKFSNRPVLLRCAVLRPT